jgi:hypothetical protein
MDLNSFDAADAQSDGFIDVDMDFEMDSHMAEDVLDGTHPIDLSHAGGEMFELIHDDLKRSRWVLTMDEKELHLIAGKASYHKGCK